MRDNPMSAPVGYRKEPGKGRRSHGESPVSWIDRGVNCLRAGHKQQLSDITNSVRQDDKRLLIRFEDCDNQVMAKDRVPSQVTRPYLMTGISL